MLIDLPELLSFFHIDPRGVIDIGSHQGQRLELYQQMKFKSVLAFEASRSNFEILKSKASSNVTVVNKALGRVADVCSLNIASNDGISSSVLKPKVHLEQYPDVKFDRTEKVEMTTLDLWNEEHKSNEQHNVVFLDVQGFEFEVLLGARKTLNNVECVICKISRSDLFENCSQATEIDLFLRTYGFRRIFTTWAGGTWGIGCYVLESFITKVGAQVMSVGLVDVNFSHSEAERGYDSACMLPTARFNWERNIRNVSLDQQIDFVVFTDSMIENVNLLKGKKKVAWIIEPREINPDLIRRITSIADQFDAVITHDKRLISSIANGHYASVACSWIKPQDWYVHDKTKLVSIIASSKTFASGHKLRHEAARLIDESDRFGSAYRKIEDKIQALGPYKFSIVIENCKQDGFFTEKLIDSLIVGTIPIYWGCSDVSEHFDPRGIIQFESLEQLERILKIDLDSFYNERKEYVQSNAVIARRYASCDETIINKITGVQ